MTDTPKNSSANANIIADSLMTLLIDSSTHVRAILEGATPQKLVDALGKDSKRDVIQAALQKTVDGLPTESARQAFAWSDQADIMQSVLETLSVMARECGIESGTGRAPYANGY